MWDDSGKKKVKIQYIESSYDNVLFNETSNTVTPHTRRHTSSGTWEGSDGADALKRDLGRAGRQQGGRRGVGNLGDGRIQRRITLQPSRSQLANGAGKTCWESGGWEVGKADWEVGKAAEDCRAR
jgi:hypothetical protein